ncbi:peroxidase 5-like [Henckelia pumila]|uniref:peroxidase 5-like n=1 Tax=Henckelia pumila TaxID=405737 RepID=UPI003C6DB7B9
MAKSKLLITFITLFILSCSVYAVPLKLQSPFRVGFYSQSCPPAEFIVQKYVSKFVRLNPGLAAGIIRLHFHDCFVRGCDASVLLDGPNSEKESIPNKGSLRGFEIIDAAKAELEIRCPGVVSCADILAFAARDSAWKVGNIYYQVPSGRRDGNVSLILDPLLNLPPPFFNATALRDNFARKGLTLDEMVTLSGAHSIGISHCTSFSTRLYPTVDPTLDPKYAAFLKTICPPPVNGTTTVNPTTNLDSLTPKILDNKYYVGLKLNKGLFTSDQTLYNSPLTKKIVLNNAQYGYTWATKFAAAMVKMGKIDVLTGTDKGEIRTKCNLVN